MPKNRKMKKKRKHRHTVDTEEQVKVIIVPEEVDYEDLEEWDIEDYDVADVRMKMFKESLKLSKKRSTNYIV